MERLLLSKIADLDANLNDPEVRRSVDRFASTYLLVALPKSSSTYCTQALARILHGDVYKDIVVQDRFTPKDLQVAGIVNARDRVKRGDINTQFVFYEDLVREPVPFFQKCSKMLGVTVSQADVNRSLAQTEKSPATRFNVGKVGRGQSELSPAQNARIRRHADYYAGRSLEPLGL